MSAWGHNLLGKELLTKTGLKATDDVLKDKSRVGIFFSAQWCPPCRSFTPDLTEFYEAVTTENTNGLEIIFVSSDRDEYSFDEYYNTMPWASVPFSNKEVKQNLAARFGVSSIPFLVIVDGADGSVKDINGRNTVAASRSNPSAAVAKWEEGVSA